MCRSSESNDAVVRALLPGLLGLADDDPLVATAATNFDRFLRSLERQDSGAQIARVLRAIARYVRVRFGVKPADLSPDQRASLVRALVERGLLDVPKRLGLPVPALRDVARGLRTTFGIAYYGQPGTDAATGYVPIWQRAEVRAVAPAIEAPPPLLDVEAIRCKRLELADVRDDALFANDGRPRVAVIGSGAGGAVVAAHLAGRFDVAVFEAGPSFERLDYPTDTLTGMSLLFEGGCQETTRTMDVHVLRARVVGGSTVVSSGMSIRPRKRTLAHWQALGMDVDEMDAALREVERRLRIEPIDDAVTTDPGRLWRAGGERVDEPLLFHVPSANVVTRAAQARDLPVRFERRGDRCLGCGLCNYGCRFGHKLSMDVTYLLDVRRAGGRVHPNLAVERLVATKTTKGARVDGVVLSRGGRPIAVDHVVLASGAIGSPALLLRSMHADAALSVLAARAHVGAGLGFNYGSTVVARWRGEPPTPGFRGVQIGFVATKPSDESFVLENAFLPPALMATVVPGIGSAHRRWMRRYRHLGMALNTIGSPQHGTVDRRGRVDYRLDASEMNVVHETLALLVATYLEGGAEEVGLAGLRGADDRGTFHARDGANRRTLLERVRRAAPRPEDLMITSAHPQGGLRFGRTPAEGAVDRQFRVHGTTNLFVADASVFPSTIVVNPQWTVMALARTAATHITSAIEGHRLQTHGKRGDVSPVAHR